MQAHVYVVAVSGVSTTITGHTTFARTRNYDEQSQKSVLRISTAFLTRQGTVEATKGHTRKDTQQEMGTLFLPDATNGEKASYQLLNGHAMNALLFRSKAGAG